MHDRQDLFAELVLYENVARLKRLLHMERVAHQMDVRIVDSLAVLVNRDADEVRPGEFNDDFLAPELVVEGDLGVP